MASIQSDESDYLLNPSDGSLKEMNQKKKEGNFFTRWWAAEKKSWRDWAVSWFTAESWRTWYTTTFTKENAKAFGKSMLKPSNYFVAFLTVSLVLVATTNRVAFKFMLVYMQNYPYFISQLSTIIYLPLFWPVVWVLMYMGKIDKTMRSFSWWKFMIMGFLDAVSGLMIVFGGNLVSGGLQQLLMQGAIPFTMLFSWLCSLQVAYYVFRYVLNAHYRIGHYLGAFIILCGVGVALVPSFRNGGGNNNFVGIALFFFSNIPTAFSGVYKEMAFKGQDLDIFYVNAWVSTWQFIWGLIFFPTQEIPWIVTHIGRSWFHKFKHKPFTVPGVVPVEKIPESLWNGMKCAVAVDSVKSLKHAADGLVLDHCSNSPLWICIYLAANILYNIVILLVLKYGSAALLYIASAVVLPLANLTFSLPFLPKVVYEKLSVFDIIGLVVILFGLVIYRLTGKTYRVPANSSADITYEPMLVPGALEVVFVPVERKKEHQPRTAVETRNTYYYKLGMLEGGGMGGENMSTPTTMYPDSKDLEEE